MQSVALKSFSGKVGISSTFAIVIYRSSIMDLKITVYDSSNFPHKMICLLVELQVLKQSILVE